MSLYTILTYWRKVFYRTFVAKKKKAINVHSTIRLLLSQMNVVWKEERWSKETKEVDYQFTYQNGNFHLIAQDSHPFTQLHFLFFLKLPFDQLDNVRYACNELNKSQSELKYIYSVLEERHEIVLHVLANFRISAFSSQLQEDFSYLLGKCFDGARKFHKHYEVIEEEGNNNLEEFAAMAKRDRYLLQELEWNHQEPQLQWRGRLKERHTMGQLLQVLFEEMSLSPHRLQVVTEELDVLTSPQQILDFDLFSPLLQHTEQGTAYFGRERVTFLLEIDRDKKREVCFIHLQAEESSPQALYTRVTFAMSPQGLSPNNSESSHTVDKGNQSVKSFIVVHELGDDKQHQIEFDYHWGEYLAAKIKDKKLTSEQRFFDLCLYPDIAYALYWGRKHFEKRHFYDALLYLENAHRALSLRYPKMTDAEHPYFFEITYFIGLCYLELNCFHRAYYYLEGIFSLNRVKYGVAFVNCLINAKDFRAGGVVKHLLKTVDEHLTRSDEEDMPEEIKHFRQFLLRRKAYWHIEQKEMEQALSILTELLQDAESQQFAMGEMAYMKSLSLFPLKEN